MSNPIPDKRLLPAKQIEFRRGISVVFQRLTQHIRGILLSAANEDGEIDTMDIYRVKTQVGQATQRTFVGQDGRAFDDNGKPQAYFPLLLCAAWSQLVADSVHAHDRFLQSYLPKKHYEALATIPSRPPNHNNPPEQAPTVPLRQMAIRETTPPIYIPPFDIRQRLRLFEPNPLAFVDPTRSWIALNGQARQNQGANAGQQPYNLSDNIWKAGQSTRSQIETLLQEGISSGISAVDLANSLENLLNPTRETRRTFFPYNSGGPYQRMKGQVYLGENGIAFDAMRLAHTTLSRGFNEATFMNGVHNPAVKGMDWRLSDRHPKRDRCDRRATLSMSGERLKDPMPLETAELPPDHPFCLCSTRSYVGDEFDRQVLLDDIAATLIAERDRILTPVMSPAQANAFIRGLLNDVLTDLLGFRVDVVPTNQIPFDPPF